MKKSLAFSVKYIVIHFVTFFSLSFSLLLGFFQIFLAMVSTNILEIRHHLLATGLAVLIGVVTLRMMTYICRLFPDIVCYEGTVLENFLAIVLPIILALIFNISGMLL